MKKLSELKAEEPAIYAIVASNLDADFGAAYLSHRMGVSDAEARRMLTEWRAEYERDTASGVC